MSLEPLDHLGAAAQSSRGDLSYRIFLGTIVHVDYERKALYIEDYATRAVYKDVTVFPAGESSTESTNVAMPERGTQCLCCNLSEKSGLTKVGVLTYVLSGTIHAQLGVASRPFEEVKNFSLRKRGMYRKAYPGEQTKWSALGYTERTDRGWDRQAMDLSRDAHDPFRRTRWSLSGRFVGKSDYQFSQEGQVVRPDSPDVFPVRLPDGTLESVLYLKQTHEPKKDPRERYLSGATDLLALTEASRKVMEFSLDHPIPREVFEDEEALDKFLGLTLPDSKWWFRTDLKSVGEVKCDDQTDMIDQTWDHPEKSSGNPVGPTKAEGTTPCRRGWIMETSEGTLVGSNKFDKPNYGKVLKPTIFPYDKKSRFSIDTAAGFVPAEQSVDEVEVKLAASMWSWRAPYEYNTTRWDVTKEGMLQFEVGSTIPKENIKWDAGKYEHPYGAGRSIEGHTTGSVKMVFGKNRDEEDALDLTALGQTILRLGADDTSLPDARRTVMTQLRGKKDVISKRELQWWKSGDRKLKSPGDAGNLEDKKAGENVSLRAALDGGMFLRLGARDEKSKRRHLYNGYSDGPGLTRWAVDDAARKDSKTNGRKTYGETDSIYCFHDLTKVTDPKLSLAPYVVGSGDPTAGQADFMGLSGDIHAVRDLFLRVGQHEKSGQSVTMDLAGGILAAIGKDTQGRSLSARLDGGIEMTVGANNKKKGVRLEIEGDVDIVIKGHLNLNVTGDITSECTHHLDLAKLLHVVRSTKIMRNGLVGIIDESIVHVKNQGNYKSSE